MDAKETLLKQFSVCYDTNGWFVSIRRALDGVTATEAVFKPVDNVNCIWETLSHLTYYNYAYLQRFKGVEYEYDVQSNDETFSTGEFTEDDWQRDVLGFDQVMNEWRDLIAAADSSKFDESVPTKPERKWSELIADVNAHNAYHGGQILLLRKLNGNWDSGKGVS